MAFVKSTFYFLIFMATCGLAVYVNKVSAKKNCRMSCDRRSKVMHVGFNAVVEPISIDVGECKYNYTVTDDCQLPVTGSSTRGCSMRDCQPRAYEVIPVNDRSNPRTEIVVKSCYAPVHKCLSRCVRKPSYVFLFSGSAFQKKVDVGKCVGQCHDDDSLVKCVATRNISAATQGPNGAVVLSVIKECSCGNTNCYRADHLESYTTLVKVGNQSNVEKVINVGRCIGSCPGVTIPGTCYPSPDNCVLYLNERQSRCVPIQGHVHEFTDTNNVLRQVPAVISCGCGTG